ncbi:hypothetical protein LRR18_15300 [Mangrovimonas sp. AS39]|uniref:hypothetical protein n=1 Tax=Mangrovimonas futianensis TaxID=2895523 RepID=UPI001E553727|nr:hypothetical protein [Mangrovimonas futianensis]MCF1192958.1 hypothetical protein [Mangrovimonas futianensis]MCF1196649.1 hypothetical protein [Mangrovimonas futianensis]MCF1421576.1 hypothetical protein [Mangrovimonas futianensis]
MKNNAKPQPDIIKNIPNLLSKVCYSLTDLSFNLVGTGNYSQIIDKCILDIDKAKRMVERSPKAYLQAIHNEMEKLYKEDSSIDTALIEYNFKETVGDKKIAHIKLTKA